MSLQHINVKFFVDGALPVEEEEFINLFHRWVADQSTNELLIDVADYRHVPNGPSVVLVGLEAHYVLDNSQGRCGLLYNRIGALDGSDEERMSQAVHAAVIACQRLEQAFEGLRFKRDEFQILVNDRLVQASGEEAEAKAGIESFVTRSLGCSGAEFKYEGDKRCRIGCVVQLAQPLEFEKLVAV